MAADLPTLRRAVAEVLPEPEHGWLTECPLAAVGATHRYAVALWRLEPGEHTRGEWLPVLDDAGTRGVMLGELERRRGVLETITVDSEGTSAAVGIFTGLGDDWCTGATLGEALARALVRVVGGRDGE